MTSVFDNSSFSTDSWESTDTNLTFESSDNQALVMEVVLPLSPLPLLISSACCLAVLKYQLKDLNEIIKNIIKTICYHNLIACILIILSGVYLYFTHDSSPVICNLSVYAIGVTNSMPVHSIGIISVVRYYIAKKTSNQEMAKKSVISGIVISVYLAEYVWTLIAQAYTVYLDRNLAVQVCTRTPLAIQDINLFQIFRMTSWMISGSVTIVASTLLGCFIKEKNKVHPNGPGQVHLVPWKSTNEPQFTYNVPISACLVTIATWICFVLWMILLPKLIHLGQNKFMYALPLRFLLTSLLMPILLLLTMRAKKKVKPMPQVPKVLHFHSQEFEEEGEASSSNQEHSLDIQNMIMNRMLMDFDKVW